MPEEIQIIKRVISGDTDSFRLLVDRYQGPIMSMIANIIADRHICEDIAQDVFFTAYRKLESFDPARSEFSTWLFTIARNKAINVLKKKRPLTTHNPPETVDESSPPTHLGKKEVFELLDRAIGKLSPKLKTAFVLAEFERLPYHQIAQIECISPGTVKSRVHRARKKLSHALREYKGEIE